MIDIPFTKTDATLQIKELVELYRCHLGLLPWEQKAAQGSVERGQYQKRNTGRSTRGILSAIATCVVVRTQNLLVVAPDTVVERLVNRLSDLGRPGRTQNLEIFPFHIADTSKNLQGRLGSVLYIDHRKDEAILPAINADFELLVEDVRLSQGFRFAQRDSTAPKAAETFEEQRWKDPSYRAQYCGFSKGVIEW